MIKELLVKALTVGGKKLSKKVIIAGGAGLGVAAAGTTAGVIIHKKKETKAAESEAPVEEAGAEKQDDIKADPKAEEASTTEEKVETTAVAEAKEELKQEPVADTKAETPVQPQVNPQPQMQQAPPMHQDLGGGAYNPWAYNPNPGFVPQQQVPQQNYFGPNPAFQYAAQNGIDLNQPVFQGPIVTAPQQQTPPMSQFNPEVKAEVKAEVSQEPEAPAPVVEDQTVADPNPDLIGAADIAKGTVSNKSGKKNKKKK